MLGISVVSANEDINETLTDDIQSQEVMLEETLNINDSEVVSSDNENNNQESLESTEDIVTVNDLDELQYYCSLSDKDYTVKLKENTNFYPSNPSSGSCQIKIKNNVKIIGSEGSWIGDSSSNSQKLMFLPIVVEDNARVSLTLDTVTFKWITVAGGFNLPDGRFIYLGGKKNSILKDCRFIEMNIKQGHSCIVHLAHSTATLDNCSFINCTSGYGCVSVYAKSGEAPSMIVQNCYFEDNYATTEPGCINNCGKLTVYNTTFIKNRSFWWAGAIHTHSGGSSTIYDSFFIDNVAGWNGGALYTYGNLKVYNSIFRGNNCTTDNGGGAIGACEYGSIPHIYVEGCLFEDNANNCWGADSLSDGPGRGGAISIMDRGSLEVRDTIFIENSAVVGTAICAIAVSGYGSPDVIIVNNSFINHTRSGDVLNIRLWDTIKNISDNYYYGNSIVFSNLTLTKLSEGKEQAYFEVSATLSNPGYYDLDILNKTSYDVFVNNKFVKTVDSSKFSIDFGDLDICNVYVVPTISNRKSNEVTATSTREYVFVSKAKGNNDNNGLSRDTPVNTISRALELAGTFHNIILLDGDYQENIVIGYDVTIKGESNATLINGSSFGVNSDNFTLKNLNINNLKSNTFINLTKGNLLISNCIIINNDALLFENNGNVCVKDSILLNNSRIIDGTGSYVLDCNWWGSALENPDKPVDLNISNWIVLSITADKNRLEDKQSANVNIDFYLNNQKYTNLPPVDFKVIAVNGIALDTISAGSSFIFTLSELENASVSVIYNEIQSQVDFEFAKSNPNIKIQAEDVMFGDDLIIKVMAPGDASGNVTVFVGDMNQTQEIKSAITTFTFTNLKADTYTVKSIYSGNKKYMPQNLTEDIKVSKYDSATSIAIGPVVVDQNVMIEIAVNADATGNVTLYINGQMQSLTLNDAKANHTMLKVPRGDYIITAIYNGDDKYSMSQSSTKIEVDNIESSIKVEVEDITYGDVATVKVILNDDATGNVSITIDGITNSSAVTNGVAVVSISGLNAGTNKNVTVFYTGDDSYFNRTANANFTINKADLTFEIESSDIKIGQYATIIIHVPPRTIGTFTINGEVISIPMSGVVEYIIPDLEIGDYEIVAFYEGDNYNGVSNSTSFSVLEFPSPQWANDGADSENTHQSTYSSNANGGISGIISIDGNIVTNIVVDSEGNYYISTESVIYSFDKNGNCRWNFTVNALDSSFAGLAIGRDVIIAPKSGDTLYFINQTSGEKYGSNLYQGSSVFSPVIDGNANVYVVSEYQYDSSSYKLVKIPYNAWEFGGELQFVDLESNVPLCSPTVSDDVIVVVSENRLRIIDAKTFKVISSKSGNYQNVRPVIGEGNMIYAVLSDSIVAYNSNGIQQWKKKMTGGIGVNLAFDLQMGLYATNAKGNLYRYDSFTGAETLVSDLEITSGILIGADHNIYFGCDNLFYAIDSKGSVLWKSDLDSKITGSPVMSMDGTLYVTSDDNKVFTLAHDDLSDVNMEAEFKDNTLTVTLDSQATGHVSFTVNGVTYNETVTDGKLTKSIPNLNAGSYNVNVVYSGDLRFNASIKIVSFTIKAAPQVNVPVSSGNDVTISLPSDATGTVTVQANGKTYTKDLVNGKATVTLPGGNYNAVITYSGDDKYDGFTITKTVNVKKPVVKKASKITAKKKTFKKSLKTKKYTVTLKSGKTPIKKVKLIIKIGKKTFKAKTNNKGKATFKIKLKKKGTYKAKITFRGNAHYKATSKKVKIVLR